MKEEKVLGAAKCEDLRRVRAYIEKEGVSPKTRERLVDIALERGNLNLLKYVLEKYPSMVKEPRASRSSPTILEKAVKNGQLEIVKYLVESHNGDIFQERWIDDYSGYHWSSVCIAISYEHLNILKYFIEERHVNVNTGTPEEKLSNRYNVRPLLFQVAHNIGKQHNITNYLVEEKKADLAMIDRNGRNILYTAVKCKDGLNILKYVIDKKKAKIDINWRDNDGRILLYHAVEKFPRYMDIIRYLVEQKGADVNIPENKRNYTPLHEAIDKLYDCDNIVRYLIDHGADLEKKDNDGETPLHLVSRCGTSELCEYLLENGANVKQKNNNGETALNIAIRRSNPDASIYLMDHSSDDDINNIDKNGETLVHKAATNNQIRLLDYLVSKRHFRVDVPRTTDLWTPLHCAAFWDHYTACKYLIEHGADPRAEDRMGKTPADIAFDENIVNYIQGAMKNIRSRRSAGYITNLPAPQAMSYRGARYQVAQTSYQSEATTTFEEIQSSFYFQSFLIFTNFLIARFLGTPAIDTDNNNLSGIGVLENEVNHVAEDAIRTFQAFNEPDK